jgi:hypothetical protein
VKIYGARPPHDEAAALVRRRINIQMKHKWPGEDLRDHFVLVPILHRNFSMASGRDYFDRQWGVRVDDVMIGYVRGTHSGKPRFLAYGLSPTQYQIDDEQIGAEVAEALAKEKS